MLVSGVENSTPFSCMRARSASVGWRGAVVWKAVPSTSPFSTDVKSPVTLPLVLLNFASSTSPASRAVRNSP